MIIRQKHGKGYKYYSNDIQITNKKQIKEIEGKMKQLRIPPGYIDVVLTPESKSIIAKCKDVDNRSQYIYHPEFVNKQQKIKYCNLIEFGKALPKIEKQIKKDMKKKSDRKSYLIAVMLQVILACNFRIGNEKYKEKYNSRGVSTIEGDNLKGREIKFIGKKGVENKCVIHDKYLLNILNSLKKERGKHIFTYDGYHISSDSVNDYLKVFGPFTTKYFRTWAANIEYIKGITAGKDSKELIKEIAVKLNHSPAICKKNYLYKDLTDYTSKHIIKTNEPGKYFIKFLEKRC
mgnify:CR=1 FL=1